MNPGDIFGWPILKIVYRSDADKIAALLPPGIEPGAEPKVKPELYPIMKAQQALTPGQSVDRDPANDEVHSYTVDLEANQFVLGEAVQLRGDFVSRQRLIGKDVKAGRGYMARLQGICQCRG